MLEIYFLFKLHPYHVFCRKLARDDETTMLVSD